MTYTPKPGDKVTSPLLVGEWEVTGTWGKYAHRVRQGDAEVTLDASCLYLVAPPLPPEPAVGSVVRAHGKLWQRTKNADQPWTNGGGYPCHDWPHLATAPDLSPVVAVEDVAEWLRNVDYYGAGNAVANEFGGWSE